MRRTKEEATVTRARLLEAALAIFHAKGYAATTLEVILLARPLHAGPFNGILAANREAYNTLVRELGLGYILGKCKLWGERHAYKNCAWYFGQMAQLRKRKM